jgi:tRNA(Ile)-lysidine synthase
MDPTRDVESAVHDALSKVERVVLAVSGGRDSMVLMHAAASVAPEHVAAVITIDHGTGQAATDAAALVELAGATLGFQVTRRRVRPAAPTEAAWRAARWRALREEAEAHSARVATAHTQDDQVETVLMRVMRDAGARGLAGLASSGTIVRPLLQVPGRVVAEYAAARGVAFVEDPSNRDPRHLRNRLRHDLLPALERARPGISGALLEIGRHAAEWRRKLDHAIDEAVPHQRGAGELRVRRDDLLEFSPESLRVLWPALAARAGVVLDRRGTERLTSFTIQSRRGGRIQLSGGAEVERHRDELVVRRRSEWAEQLQPRPLGDATRFGAWRFERAGDAEAGTEEWVAALPTDRPLRVRTWRAGDRMVPTGERDGGARRIKRLFREAGIEAGIRSGWPVVLSGDEIVWVPGVRRGIAATVRSGRPVAVYRCERIDR